MAVAFLPVPDVNNAVQMLIANAPAVQEINRIKDYFQSNMQELCIHCFSVPGERWHSYLDCDLYTMLWPRRKSSPRLGSTDMLVG